MSKTYSPLELFCVVGIPYNCREIMSNMGGSYSKNLYGNVDGWTFPLSKKEEITHELENFGFTEGKAINICADNAVTLEIVPKGIFLRGQPLKSIKDHLQRQFGAQFRSIGGMKGYLIPRILEPQVREYLTSVKGITL